MQSADALVAHQRRLGAFRRLHRGVRGEVRERVHPRVMVDHGQFERNVEFITVKPQVRRTIVPRSEPRTFKKVALGGEKYEQKFGTEDIKIPVEQKDMMTAHIENFLSCMRTREKPHLDVETGAKAVVVINLAAQSYREGKTMYWDEKHWKASDKPVKA